MTYVTEAERVQANQDRRRHGLGHAWAGVRLEIV